MNIQPTAGVLNLYKNRGQTPLEALDALRRAVPELRSETLSYAGRLDPMAEGVLLVLVGDENKHRATYLALDKEYEMSMLCGIQTDTADILGLIQNIHPKELHGEKLDIEHAYRELIGTRVQQYPGFSSKPVDGKPLFMWARAGKLKDIEIPKHTITIHGIELLDTRRILAKDLIEAVQADIRKVHGDFRQEAIIALWQEKCSHRLDWTFPLIHFKIHASSGAYMRVVAEEIGANLGIPTCAYHIKRTRIAHFLSTKSTHVS